MLMVDGIEMFDVVASARERMVSKDGHMVVSYSVTPMSLGEYKDLLAEDARFSGHQLWLVELGTDDGDKSWTVSLTPVTPSGLSWMDKPYEVHSFKYHEDACQGYIDLISSAI